MSVLRSATKTTERGLLEERWMAILSVSLCSELSLRSDLPQEFINRAILSFRQFVQTGVADSWRESEFTAVTSSTYCSLKYHQSRHHQSALFRATTISRRNQSNTSEKLG